MIGTDPDLTGVATGAMLYATLPNPSFTDPDDDMAIGANHLATLDNVVVRAINVSIGRRNAVPDGNSKITLFVDWSAATHNVLYVVAAAERFDPFDDVAPAPADNYNGITVAASTKNGGVYRRVANFNDFALDSDAVGPRTSVDILAPGENVAMAGLNNMPYPTADSDGTSFAAPHVTGTVALLHQFATRRIVNIGTPRWDAEHARRHEVMKAVLMNSADKIQDTSGTGRLLGMERTVSDTNGFTWLQSEAYTGPDEDEIPLDNQMGAGHLNATRAVQQFSYGEYDNDAGSVPNIGWDYGTTVGVDDVNKYALGQSIGANQFISVTLAWDRQVLFDNEGATAGVYESGDTFVEDLPFNDLDLYLMPAGATDLNQYVARSTSGDSTLEHIFFEITMPGMYELWVRQFSDPSGPQNYAIAWWQGLASTAIFGDYSGDGTVGPEDYDVWKSNFGTTNSAADGNGNGIVDAADYTVWRDHLDQSFGAGSGSLTPVPEPSAVGLIFAGLLLCGGRLRGGA